MEECVSHMRNVYFGFGFGFPLKDAVRLSAFSLH